MKFKSQCDLVKENPKGLEKIDNPHNFSSNPGFMSTAGMLGASTPADPVIRGTSARGSLRPPVRSPLAPFSVSRFRG